MTAAASPPSSPSSPAESNPAKGHELHADRCIVVSVLRQGGTLTDHGCGCGAEKRDEGEHGDLPDERGHRLEHQHRVHVQVLQVQRMRFSKHDVR